MTAFFIVILSSSLHLKIYCQCAMLPTTLCIRELRSSSDKVKSICAPPEIITLFVSLKKKITAIVCKNLICQSSFLPILNYVYIYRLEPPACSILLYNHISMCHLMCLSTFKYSAQLSSIKTFFSTSLKSCEQAF